VGRYGESTAVARGIGRVAIGKGVVPVHLSSDGDISSSEEAQGVGLGGLLALVFERDELIGGEEGELGGEEEKWQV
jgi:hypothetical protein